MNLDSGEFAGLYLSKTCRWQIFGTSGAAGTAFHVQPWLARFFIKDHCFRCQIMCVDVE